MQSIESLIDDLDMGIEDLLIDLMSLRLYMIYMGQDTDPVSYDWKGSSAYLKRAMDFLEQHTGEIGTLGEILVRRFR